MKRYGRIGGLLALVLAGRANAAPPVPSANSATSSVEVAPPSPGLPPSQPASATPPAPDMATPSGAAPAGSSENPPPAGTPEPQQAGAEEQERIRQRDVERQRRRRRLQLQAEAEREDEEEEAERRRRAAALPRGYEGTPQGTDTWSLVGPHFLLGVERVTNLLSWSQRVETPVVQFDSIGGQGVIELETSGTDVAFLGSGSTPNPFSLPRLAFDGMFESGLTLGGALMYVRTSGKQEVAAGGSQKTSLESATSAVFILAPRVGVMIESSSAVAVWLRGGITRTSIATQLPTSNAETDEVPSGSREITTTLVDVSLDPQLVISPVPHVGVTVGLALDIGVAGSLTDAAGDERAMKASSYGVSGGLLALF